MSVEEDLNKEHADIDSMDVTEDLD